MATGSLPPLAGLPVAMGNEGVDVSRDSEPAEPRGPGAGDVLLLTRRASPQFVKPMMFRVIRPILDWTCAYGWLWLDGYQLGANGDAVERRTVFVKLNGLQRVTPPTPSKMVKPVSRP